MFSNLVIAFVLLPIMGALIAWAGDVIGYRLGKSRRSLFGLRPRTTARAVGAAVGALLPLAGLLFAMAVSQDARDAILRIDDLRQQASSLSQRLPQLQAEVRRTQQEARSERDRAHAANLSRLKAEEQLATSQRTLASVQTVLRNTQGSLQLARTSLGKARTQLVAARSGLVTARRDLGTAKTEVTRANTELARSKRDLAGARADLARAQSDTLEAKTELEAAKTDLADKQKLLQSAVAELQTADKVHREVEQAQAHLTELSDQLAETEESLARYKIALSAMVGQDVAYEPGEELIRAIVESDRSEQQLESILYELLNFASAAAVRQGIAVGPNLRAVRVLSPIPPGLPPSRATEADIVREVAENIHSGAAPTYVVIVRAWGRAFKRQAEQMTAEFWVAPNRTVFQAGETVLSSEVDGSLPRAYVFRELWQTVSAMRRVAADRGMLPSPKSGRYGEVPAEELLSALDKLLAINGPARVSVVVLKDTPVASPGDQPMLVRLDVSQLGRQ